MNPFTSGLFGMNKAPQHQQQQFTPNMRTFGGWGPDSNPIQLAPAPPPQVQAGSGGAGGPGSYWGYSAPTRAGASQAFDEMYGDSAKSMNGHTAGLFDELMGKRFQTEQAAKTALENSGLPPFGVPGLPGGGLTLKQYDYYSG